MKTYKEKSKALFINQLKTIDKALKGISYCFIGAVAVKEYGYERQTEDVDILIKKSQERETILALETNYKTKNIDFKGIKVDLVFSGERFNEKGLNYPDPENVTVIHDGLPFVNFKELIRLKLDSAIYGKRLQDSADVQELIQVNKLDFDFADEFDEAIKLKYQEIWKDKYISK